MEKTNKQETTKQPVNKQRRFGIFDWVVMVFCIFMVPSSIMIIIIDIPTIIISGITENLSQIIADIIILTISLKGLKSKLGKFKEIKTPKSYKIVFVTSIVIAIIMIVPIIFSILSVFYNAKSTSKITPEQELVINNFMSKAGELGVINQSVKLSTISLAKSETNTEYNKKSLELLNNANGLQIKLDDLKNYLSQNLTVFTDSQSREAMNALLDVFNFRIEHNKKLIELVSFGSYIDFSNKSQADQFTKITDELTLIEDRLPEVESKFLKALSTFDTATKEKVESQLKLQKDENQKLLF